MPSITALLPAYNERLRGCVVLRTKQYADRIIFIDDGRRYLNGNKKDTPFYRWVGQNGAGCAAANTDCQSGFRAYGKMVKCSQQGTHG